jgi:hypothetical protein
MLAKGNQPELFKFLLTLNTLNNNRRNKYYNTIGLYYYKNEISPPYQPLMTRNYLPGACASEYTNVGLNVKDKKDDYYEYMLADNPSEPEYMLLTNVVGYKAGSSLALVKNTGRQNPTCSKR